MRQKFLIYSGPFEMYETRPYWRLDSIGIELCNIVTVEYFNDYFKGLEAARARAEKEGIELILNAEQYRPTASESSPSHQ